MRFLLFALALPLLVAAPPYGRVKLAAKPKPVRAALESRYAEMRRGYFERDTTPILASRRADAFTVTPKGDTTNAGAVRAYIRASFAQVETTLVLDWKLGVIDVHGDTAAVELDQHWMRRQRKAGAIRNVETSAPQRETWIRDRGGWFLWRVDHVTPGIWRVDGKRTDPSKPYDPAAPEYRPGSE